MASWLNYLQYLLNIPSNASWEQNASTIAGGRGEGGAFNQLRGPFGLYVDYDDATTLIAERYNHRIVEWKSGATSGQLIFGDGSKGKQTDELNEPSDVHVDKETDSLIICDSVNRRVIRWYRGSGSHGEVLIGNIGCCGLTMDNEKLLYVTDFVKHEVRQYRIGETTGEVVAGGNGQGDRLNQLNWPSYVFVDRDHSVYVSDQHNHRVMKWVKGAKEGIVVAGGRYKGDHPSQLSYPQGVLVDLLGTVYVADFQNHRVVRWRKNATQVDIVVGNNGRGANASQLNFPVDLSFDRHGNLYVTDSGNNRVQRFAIKRS
ncbi:unnamed protein product [Rotaria sp. Silwood1]|nr:unnamed protein product [Rotaria sp. Silwood1]